jgi:hypothetical protein
MRLVRVAQMEALETAYRNHCSHYPLIVQTVKQFTVTRPSFAAFLEVRTLSVKTLTRVVNIVRTELTSQWLRFISLVLRVRFLCAGGPDAAQESTSAPSRFPHQADAGMALTLLRRVVCVTDCHYRPVATVQIPTASGAIG